MYYGNATVGDGQNATAVWDANFTVVHHLANSLGDATSNANNGTNVGSTNTTTGKIGDARNFSEPSSQYYFISTAGMNAHIGTVEAWAFPVTVSVAGSSAIIFSHRATAASDDRIYLQMHNGVDPNDFRFAIGDSGTPFIDSLSNLTMSAWNHVAMTWNNGTYKAYLNGTMVKTGSYLSFDHREK